MAKGEKNKEKLSDCPQGLNLSDRKNLLQKIIDGQASVQEEQYFYQSIANCQKCHCRDWCNSHIEIKALLKNKLSARPAPNGLLDEIKEKMKGID